MQYGGTFRGPRPPFLIPGSRAALRLETEGLGAPPVKRQKLEIDVHGSVVRIRIHCSFSALCHWSRLSYELLSPCYISALCILYALSD